MAESNVKINDQKKGKFQDLRSLLSTELQQKWEQEQLQLKAQLIEENDFNWTIHQSENSLKLVGGMDISFYKESNNKGYAFLTVVTYPDLKVAYQDYEYIETDVPYVPGFLAFREYPSCVKLLQKMKDKNSPFYPQVILLDGNGILHPFGFGLASHIGVLMDIPCIGCSKTVFSIDGLNKKNVRELTEQKLKKGGDSVKLVGQSGKVWGAALLSTDLNKDPLIISIGHKISIESALLIVSTCCKVRVPEPIRLSDLASRELLKKNKI